MPSGAALTKTQGQRHSAKGGDSLNSRVSTGYQIPEYKKKPAGQKYSGKSSTTGNGAFLNGVYPFSVYMSCHLRVVLLMCGNLMIVCLKGIPSLTDLTPVSALKGRNMDVVERHKVRVFLRVCILLSPFFPFYVFFSLFRFFGGINQHGIVTLTGVSTSNDSYMESLVFTACPPSNW